jgi:hypothetical protein
MSLVTLQMQEALEKARRFDDLSIYSYKLIESANKAMVLNEKSKVLLEECLKELTYLQELIDGRPEEATQDKNDVQDRDAKSHIRKNAKAKKADS